MKINVTKSSLPPIEEYIEMISPLWDSAWLTNMGELHCRLQKELEKYLELEKIQLFSNGHMALELALQALELQGEVITTPFSFASTTHAIVRNGLTPVFCDIDIHTYNIDVGKIEGLITEKTCAIIPVHVYGNPCDVVEIDRIAKKYNLKVIYDAAHAFGTKYRGKSIGNFGDLSMFSFHATKVFHTIEGGAIAYQNEKVGEKLYNLKNFGIRSSDEVVCVGANAKMNEFQAAMGLCNLKYIQQEIEKRKKVYFHYIERLSSIDGIITPIQQDGIELNYAYMPVLFDEIKLGYTRDELADRLQNDDIFVRKYFYPIIPEYKCYKDKYKDNSFEIASYVSRHILTLPLYADLDVEIVDKICDIIVRMKI